MEANTDPEPSGAVAQGQDVPEFERGHRDGPTSYYRTLTSEGSRRADMLEAAAGATGAAGDDRLTTRPVDWELQRRVPFPSPRVLSARSSSAAWVQAVLILC